MSCQKGCKEINIGKHTTDSTRKKLLAGREKSNKEQQMWQSKREKGKVITDHNYPGNNLYTNSDLKFGISLKARN